MPAQSARAVVVDPHSGRRGRLCTVLEVLGFECQEAATGHEALALAEAWACDVVLLDLQVAGRRVFELARMLHAAGEAPLLVTMDHATGLTPDAVMELGIAGVLVRPFTPTELAAELFRVRSLRSTNPFTPA